MNKIEIFTILLDKRQACAIESAIVTQSNAKHRRVLVVVVLTSDVLDINANNATKQIYEKYIGSFW